MRQVLSDPAGRLDEIDGVVVVFLNAGGNREDIRIEHDVFGRHTDLFGQDLVGARADFLLALEGIGLTGLVERHHDHGSAITAAQFGLAQELGLAFLERNRVDDGLALHALETGLDDAPLGAVDHDRHPCDVRLGCDQIQKARHGRLRIEHRFVHVDVDHLRTVVDLLARHGQRCVELVVEDHACEGFRAGHIGALTDIDEQRLVVNVEGFKARQAHRGRLRADAPWPLLGQTTGHGRDMIGRGTRSSHRRC